MTSATEVYEYAVIRVVPRPDREEFINAGIILFCKRKRFLKAVCQLDENRLKALFPDCELPTIADNLRSLEAIASGSSKAGPIALLETAERFRWLTAVRSTMIQTSRPHPGLTQDPESCLTILLTDLVP
ncbi:MAG: DUF3037 domain-containing protein [Sphingobacteriales bacterium]|nr:MAG: DUF3037 domain-containing protein [Sphingobacteriales bacterium]